jgi:DNA helicase II / ATP-dependent DNA helicase PcrA
MEPTSEQKKIIEHTSGHALVFAVAGSGKTATMIQRILHLIREARVRPVRILACTFSKEAAHTIELRLAQHPEAAGVKVATLHALAHLIVREASRLGFTEVRRGDDDFSRRLYQQARAELIEGDASDKSGYYAIKYDDFETYLSVQKGQLHLPYVPDDLPDEAQQLISPPDRGIDLYAELYERHDALRLAEGRLGFDDTIVQAWMLMARFPELQQVMRGKWDHINVDEFQDVNLAQYEMMDLLASQCTSYVAIGDDDQTVYQWRGANPRFILNFPERYQATRYTLSTNFRCPMGVIALADAMIQHNTVREPKRLRASRGGNGVFLHPDSPGQAARVAIDCLQNGRPARDILILVRAYAQTGEIEQVFLEQGVPYLIVGGVPFYKRREVQVLLAYLRLALADLDGQRGVPVSAERRLGLVNDWKLVANTPNRYLRAEVVAELTRGVWRSGLTLAAKLAQAAAAMTGGAQRHLQSLCTALTDLTDDLGLAHGKQTLLNFAEAIKFTAHLVDTAPTRDFGEERAGSVRALAEMARERSLGQLLIYIDSLSQQGRHVDRLSAAEDDDVDRVTIMTAFRAKGLERPVVVVPGCSEGLYRIRPGADIAAAEEERRIFYVALTRAQEELHLVVDSNEPTAFLRVIEHEVIVQGHTRLAQILARNPAQWSGRDTLEASRLLRRYGHEQFVQLWLDAGYRPRLLQRIQALQHGLLGHPALQFGREEVGDSLNLQRYEAHGVVELDNDPQLLVFQDLDQLTRELHHQHEERRLAKQPATAPQRGRPTGTALCPSDIHIGIAVKHLKYGSGQVLSTRGHGDGLQVEIRFQGMELPIHMMSAFANLISDEPVMPAQNQPAPTFTATPPEYSVAPPQYWPSGDVSNDRYKDEDLPF